MAIKTPISEKPLLVGLLVDVSASMTQSIRNELGTSQNRLQSFRDAFEELISDARKLTQGELGQKLAPRMKFFAYGFGFGNPLTMLLGKAPKVRDFLDLPGSSDSTVSIDMLAANWERYRKHIEQLIIHMFGDTPLGEALQIAEKRLIQELDSNQYTENPILFVLSDGDPTDASVSDIKKIMDRIKKSGTHIISCYVTDENITEPRHLYSRTLPGWSIGANLMFECASSLPPTSPYQTYLKELNWVLEPNCRLFAQVNQSETLAEFMNLILSRLENSRPIRAIPASVNDNSTKRTKVFISYSHVDKAWLERVLVHLKPLERSGSLDIWDDTKIKAGDQWKVEIEKALHTARVGLLLITPNFLASDFIVLTELPALLKAAEQDGAKIIPLIIKPSRFAFDEELSKFQAANPPSSPLIALSEAEQDQILVDLSRTLENYLNHD